MKTIKIKQFEYGKENINVVSGEILEEQLNTIKKNAKKTLTPKEVKALYEIMDAATDSTDVTVKKVAASAREYMIVKNMPLVISYANKFWASHEHCGGLTFDDLLQEGYVGLLEAVKRFDPHKGYRFSTYSIFWIKRYMLRTQAYHGPFYLPPEKKELMNNIKKAINQIEMKTGKAPTDDDLANLLEIRKKLVTEMLTYINRKFEPAEDTQLNQICGTSIDYANPELLAIANLYGGIKF